jgi:hypothetical protein
MLMRRPAVKKDKLAEDRWLMFACFAPPLDCMRQVYPMVRIGSRASCCLIPYHFPQDDALQLSLPQRVETITSLQCRFLQHMEKGTNKSRQSSANNLDSELRAKGMFLDHTASR